MQRSFSPDLSSEPLHQRAYDVIRREFVDGKLPGMRLPSITDLEKFLGVSLTTVRMALGRLKQEGLVQNKSGGATYVGTGMLAQKHVAVLLDVDVTSQNLSPYWLRSVREIQKALEEQGMPARLYFGDLPLGQKAVGITCQYLLEDIRLDRVNGLISFFTKRNPAWIKTLNRQRVPVLDPEGEWQTRLRTQAMELFLHNSFLYLKQSGCCRPATMLWEGVGKNAHAYRDTFFRLAREYGFSVDRGLLDFTANGWEPGMGWERFRDIWQGQKERPDALIVADDALFMDCQRAIVEMGVAVPEDLKVMVSSSDAVELDLEIPVGLFQLLVEPDARLYAKQMRSVLYGEIADTPSMPSYTLQFSAPSQSMQGTASVIKNHHQNQ